MKYYLSLGRKARAGNDSIARRRFSKQSTGPLPKQHSQSYCSDWISASSRTPRASHTANHVGGQAQPDHSCVCCLISFRPRPSISSARPDAELHALERTNRSHDLTAEKSRAFASASSVRALGNTSPRSILPNATRDTREPATHGLLRTPVSNTYISLQAPRADPCHSVEPRNSLQSARPPRDPQARSTHQEGPVPH